MIVYEARIHVEKPADELVRELLALYARYGANAFEAAITALKDGQAIQRVIDAARGINDVKPAFPTKPTRTASKKKAALRTSPREALAKFVSNLRETGSRREINVADFVAQISTKGALSSPRALRDFIIMIRLPSPGEKLDRHILAKKIAKRLLELPDHELDEKIKIGHDMSPEASSLMGWSNIIVRKDTDEDESE